MCAALLKQSCFVEWSGNLLWSLEMVLFSFPSGASGLYFNACPLVVSFVLFLQWLSDAIPNAWCVFHLHLSILRQNSESWSGDIYAFSDLDYCKVFHNNFLCTPAQSSVSAVCKCLMGSENMIEMAMSQNCCSLKSLCLDISVIDVPKSAVKNVVEFAECILSCWKCIIVDNKCYEARVYFLPSILIWYSGICYDANDVINCFHLCTTKFGLKIWKRKKNACF